MFFQPIVLDRSGFQLKNITGKHYPMHWHSDLEVLYCESGAFMVENEEAQFRLEPGDLIFIGSCEPHCLISEKEASGYIFSLGFHFFGDDFEKVRTLRFDPPVIRGNEKIKEEIEAITALHTKEKQLADHMELRGRMYRMTSLLLNGLPVSQKASGRQQERLFAVSKIQKALDFVATHYSENITLEQASEVSGYEKSSFCRSFKNATNSTFHKYLNMYRASKAKILLTETDDSISVISYRVGFTQHKNFCRLFKELYGLSPTEYRKKYR